jgi:hypothetical protein
MNLQKAFQRFEWRLSNGKFEPNQGDIDALQFIAEWVNWEKEVRVNENRYFGKIVIYCLLREMDYFGDIHLAETKIHDVLKKPIEYWYDRVRLIILLKEFEDSKSVLGIKEFVELWDNAKDESGFVDRFRLDPQIQANLELLQMNAEPLKKSLDSWKQKEINDKLNNFISDLLNEYGTKP